jgi:hypothetical protein
VETLLALAPDDPGAISARRERQLRRRQGQAAARCTGSARALRREAHIDERADAMLGLGEALLKARRARRGGGPAARGRRPRARVPEPLALCKVHEAKKDWEEVVRLKTRRLDVVSGDERGPCCSRSATSSPTKLGDRTRAAKSYVAALDERPDDRKTLTKLMQLYSEEKDWSKLIEVVLKLASKVDDPSRR